MIWSTIVNACGDDETAARTYCDYVETHHPDDAKHYNRVFRRKSWLWSEQIRSEMIENTKADTKDKSDTAHTLSLIHI